MLEAICNLCGKTFIPASETDLIHEWDEEEGRECGGKGVIVRRYTR